MVVYYAQDFERWEDDEDDSFNVSMTPECPEDLTLEFPTQKDFFEWYNATGKG